MASKPTIYIHIMDRKAFSMVVIDGHLLPVRVACNLSLSAISFQIVVRLILIP